MAKKKKQTKRRRNPGIAELAAALELLRSAPAPRSRAKNPGWMKARAVRIRRSGKRVLVDVLR